MKLTIKLDFIDYGDVAVKLIPMMGQSKKGGSIGLALDALATLPEDLIRQVFDVIPQQRKDEIVAAFAMEKKDTLLGMLNDMSRKQELGITLENYRMDPELNIIADVAEIDYLRITERFLPVLRGKLLTMLLIMRAIPPFLIPTIKNATAEQLLKLLDRFVRDKDSMVASLINQNQQKLILLLERTGRKQGIHVKIGSVCVEA